MNFIDVKSKKNVKKLLNDKHNIFDIKNISINKILEIIDDNVSEYRPENPLFYFSNIIKKEKYKFLEKFKVLLIALDFLCDEERVQLDINAFVSLNSAKFILQKFTYSLMSQHESGELKQYSSILWYVSLGKTLIDTLALNLDGHKTISSRIENFFNKKLLNLWKKWSNVIKNPRNNPYIMDGEYRFDILYDEIFREFEIIPKKLVNYLSLAIKDKKIKVIMNNFIAFIDLIDKNINKEMNSLPKLCISTKMDIFNYIMMNEFRHFLIISEIIGYWNPVFLRAFIPIIKNVAKKEKIALAKYSHKNLYKEMAILKYDKKFNLEIKNTNSESTEIIGNFIMKIYKYFNENN